MNLRKERKRKKEREKRQTKNQCFLSFPLPPFCLRAFLLFGCLFRFFQSSREKEKKQPLFSEREKREEKSRATFSFFCSFFLGVGCGSHFSPFLILSSSSFLFIPSTSSSSGATETTTRKYLSFAFIAVRSIEEALSREKRVNKREREIIYKKGETIKWHF